MHSRTPKVAHFYYIMALGSTSRFQYVHLNWLLEHSALNSEFWILDSFNLKTYKLKMTPYLTSTFPKCTMVEQVQNNIYYVHLEQGGETKYTKLLAQSNFKISQGSVPRCLSGVLYSSLGMILPGFGSVLGSWFFPLRHVSLFIRKLTLQLINLLNLCPNTLFALHCLNFLISQIVMLP